MRTLSRDTWLYSWFDNSLRDLRDEGIKLPLAGPPGDVCSFFWSFLWNGLVYLWCLVTAFVFPMVFLAVFFLMGGGAYSDMFGFDLFLNAGEHMMGGVELLLESTVGRGPDADIRIVLPVCLVFMLLPFVCGAMAAVVIFFMLPLGLVLFGFTEMYNRIRTRREERDPSPLDELAGVVVDRVDGFLNGFCVPIEWKSSTDEK